MTDKNLLVDSALLFRCSIPIRPLLQVPKKLEVELPAEYTIPYWAKISGQEPFAEARVGWAKEGIYFQFETFPPTKLEPSMRLHRTYLWINTRALADQHQINRFCHQFNFDVPVQFDWTQPQAEIEVPGRVGTIRVSQNDFVPFNSSILKASMKWEAGRCYWRIWVPAEALTGYQPTEFSSLGIFYTLTLENRRLQTPMYHQVNMYEQNPSYWLQANCLATADRPVRKKRANKGGGE